MLTCVDASSATFDLWSLWQLQHTAFGDTAMRSFALHARLDLRLRTLETFRLSSKHFPACECVVSLISHGGEGSPPTVAPRRRGSTRMSRSYNSWWTLHRKRHPRELGLRRSFSFLSLCFAKKGLHAISLHNWLWWLCRDFCVQAWRFLDAVLFERRCSPWFNDVVLYFWFHAC
jgi:hypothetical protein